MAELGRCDVAVIGGGIVGLASALAIAQRARAVVAVVEAEDSLAAHQTGHNSGVIHSGLYYAPGSLKARNCTLGRALLEQYCEAHGIPFRRCGKVVVARCPEELPALEELARRGAANGLAGIRRLSPAELAEVEPHAAGVAALWVPQTGVVDYRQVAASYAEELKARDGAVWLGAPVRGVQQRAGELVLLTPRGAVQARGVVNCAGLQADRVARLCGVRAEVRIVPFRGEYYELDEDGARLVRGLIYPVPDPRFPFLGVHFTRRVTGQVEAGPNAVLAFKREGYRRSSFSLRDTAATLGYVGFWRLATRYFRTGFEEMVRSWSTAAFLRALQRLLPALQRHHLRPGGAGVRAQALDRTGRLLDDFCIVPGERQIHVLNAPSPAATASLAIGQTIAAMAVDAFSLPPRREP